MKGLSKFLKNKNTVTILGVLACIAILFVGYHIRINQKTSLVTVYYANQTIQPKTLITEEMVSRAQVPQSFIKGDYFKNYDYIVGKYSNYNTMIAEGSLFYYDLLIEEQNLPDAVLYEINEGERLYSWAATIESTYGNSIMPGNMVDIYVKLINSDNKVVYGEFYDNIEVLGVKDANGRNVFENTEESRLPAFVYFSLPETEYLLLSSLKYIKEDDDEEGELYKIKIVLVPNTVKYEDDDPAAVEVTSDYLYKFVLDKISQIDDQKELYAALLNSIEQNKLEKKKAREKANTTTDTTTNSTTNNTTNNSTTNNSTTNTTN